MSGTPFFWTIDPLGSALEGAGKIVGLLLVAVVVYYVINFFFMRKRRVS